MMRSSHILCKVHDLQSAVKAWEALGFTVQLGDAPGKALNALIWFETGPFIELIDMEKAQPPAILRWLMKVVFPGGMMRRFDAWRAAPEGWCDFALETHEGSVTPEVKRLRDQGMKVFGPVKNQRTPADSETITTQTAFPYDPALPFLMGAYRPDPRPKSIGHKNGATAVSSVTFALPDESRAALMSIIDNDDPWLKLVAGPAGVRSIALQGLSRPIDPNAANLAIIEAA